MAHYLSRATPFSLIVVSILFPLALSSSRPDTVLCPLSEYIDDNDETVREFFECPGLEDPPNHRLCCEEKCCPLVDSILQVDIRIAMIISLTVIVLCVVSGIAIVICCFVSSCPMYDTCSGGSGGTSSTCCWGTPGAPPVQNPFMGGYIPSDMHPLTLNGSKDSSLEKDHKLAHGVSPIRIAAADHV